MLEKKMLVDFYNDAMRKLFGLEPGWHKNLDIVKNNYLLAEKYYAGGQYSDAVFRLKFLLWMDKDHKQGAALLAKAQAALAGKAPAAAVVAPETDAKILYLIHKECFPIYWKEQEISDMLLTSGTQGWLASIGGKPAGMLMTRAQFEQAEILTIAVMPTARKRGVAAKLMAEAEKALAGAGVKKIFLEVAENNAQALGLYRKIGYGEVSRRAGYYRQAEGPAIDALVMAKDL